MTIQYKHIVALIYTIVIFLDRLDLTIVNIALPTIAKVFHIPITATDWVSISFLLALAISIPISCWLGDRFGYKKIYVIAMLLFGVGSTLCAWAPNLNALIALRFIHGIGGGMLIPVGMTIIYRLYDKAEYANITSFTFMPSLLAPALAPFLGGVLLDVWGWQMIFLLSGPICLILAVFTVFSLKEDGERKATPLDWQGFILFAVILLDTFYTLSLIGKNGGFPLIILNSFILVLLIYGFIKCEKSSAHPLIDLHYFDNEIFTKANLIQLCFQICHFGAIFLIGMYLQVGVGLSASLAGAIMGMQALGAITTNRYSVKLFNHDAKLPITVGLAGVAVLSPLILLINSSAIMIGFALLLFFIRGVFSGLCGTPIQTLSVISFNKDQLGTVNTIFNAFRQVSISFGVALSSGLLAMGMYFSPSHSNILKTFGAGFLAVPIAAVVGIIIVRGLNFVKN